MRNKDMFVKYTFADRDNHDDQGITKVWIEVCEANNYIFRVEGERKDKYQLYIEKRTSEWGVQSLVWIKKDRCEKYYEEVILPKELFEI